MLKSTRRRTRLCKCTPTTCYCTCAPAETSRAKLRRACIRPSPTRCAMHDSPRLPMLPCMQSCDESRETLVRADMPSHGLGLRAYARKVGDSDRNDVHRDGTRRCRRRRRSSRRESGALAPFACFGAAWRCDHRLRTQIADMRARGITPKLRTYNPALQCYCDAGDIKRVRTHALRLTCSFSGMQPDGTPPGRNRPWHLSWTSAALASRCLSSSTP